MVANPFCTRRTRPGALPYFQHDHPTESIAVADPAPGEARWYLVREDGGSYSSGGTGELPGRDAAIAASPNACP